MSLLFNPEDIGDVLPKRLSNFNGLHSDISQNIYSSSNTYLSAIFNFQSLPVITLNPPTKLQGVISEITSVGANLTERV
jgi:hypothetical protein